MFALIRYFSIFITMLLVIQETAPAEAHDIEIGAVLGLTGAAADEATGLQKGIMLAAEDLKAKGRSVKVIFEDDQTNSAKTVNSIERLRARGIRLFIGPTWGFQVQAARPVIERGELLAISPATSSDFVGESKFIFHMCPSRQRQLSVLVPWLKQAGARKVFLINFANYWGEVHKRLYKSALEQTGGNVAGEALIGFGAGIGEFQTLLAKVQRAGADLIMMTASGGEYANMIKAAKRLHMQTRVLVDENIFALYRSEPSLARSEGEKIVAFSPVISRDFIRRYHERYGEYPGLHADRAYDSLMILADTAAGTNGDPLKIREILKSSFSFKGYSGTVSFDENGDATSGDYRIFSGVHPWKE